MTLLAVATVLAMSCQETKESSKNDAEVPTTTEKHSIEPTITPISHATFVMNWGGFTWYNDPVGGAEAFEGQAKPDVVLISDIHGDHLNVETLEALEGDFQIIAPEAVYEQLTPSLQAKTKQLKNGVSMQWKDFSIQAIPMYNISEDRLQFHTKGRGNGYVLTYQDFSVYISGDTENIDEMKSLKNIDVAFVCMNLPYTMTVEQAAQGVLEFSPKKVIPYHYRGMKDGEQHFFSTEVFERLVSLENPDIKVERLNWYPEN